MHRLGRRRTRLEGCIKVGQEGNQIRRMGTKAVQEGNQPRGMDAYAGQKNPHYFKAYHIYKR